MKTRLLMILLALMMIPASESFAEDDFPISFDSVHDFSEMDFDTGQFSHLPYGEKFYQYRYHPFGVLMGDSSSRCHFTSDFVLNENSLSESGHVLYKFPSDMIWPGGYENSTFYIVRSPSFNFPEDNNFENLTPTKTDDSSIVLEFEIVTGLNTFVANSTAFWDSQRSQIIDCPNPFDFEKQEYEYYDFVYPLKVQQNYAKVLGFAEDSFLCKPELIPVLKHDDSQACVKEESVPKLIERGWMAESSNQDNHILKYSPVLFKGTGLITDDDKMSLEELQKLQQRKIEIDRLLEDRSISEKMQDDLSNERDLIQHYSQRAFDNEVSFEAISTLWEKRMHLREFLSAHDREERFPISCTGSISIGFHAYSLDEKYVGNPTALAIEVAPEHFTKTNLQKADKIIREQAGDEIDIIYEKSDCYAIPT